MSHAPGQVSGHLEVRPEDPHRPGGNPPGDRLSGGGDAGHGALLLEVRRRGERGREVEGKARKCEEEEQNRRSWGRSI